MKEYSAEKIYNNRSCDEVDSASAGLRTGQWPLLKGIKVLIITSGHDATDQRVHNKLACSLKSMGAAVAIVGQLEHPDPGDVEILVVPKPATRMKRFLLQPWRCLWAARHYHPDIIHFHDAEILVTLPVLKMFRSGCKLVYDVHEDFANLMLIRDWLPSSLKGAARWLTDFIEKKLALFADAIVGVTPPLTDKFRNKVKISACNFITRDFFERAKVCSRMPRDREFDVVHLGTLNRRRAVFLVESLRKFHEMRPHAKSLIIGVSAEIAKEMGPLLPGNCMMTGEVPYSEIPGLLGNAKIGLDVHPWPGAHLNVALPVKLFEYMASECAVVFSSMPVLDAILREAPGDLGAIRIISGGTPDDYAKAAVRLLEQIEEGGHPGRELRAFALQHMVWENEAEKVAGLYLGLLGKR